MTILSKEEVEEMKEYFIECDREGDMLCFIEQALDLIDTIADRDKQIQDLQAKVEELGEYAKPFEHKFGCDRFLCTCVAVKEPKAVMEEPKYPITAQHKPEDCLCDDCFFRRTR